MSQEDRLEVVINPILNHDFISYGHRYDFITQLNRVYLNSSHGFPNQSNAGEFFLRRVCGFRSPCR